MIPLVYDQINNTGKDGEFFSTLLERLNIKAVADLGCGTGRLTSLFVRDGYDITAIDPNEEAIEFAKGKEYAGEITWLVGDSSKLQMNIFDAVIMTANVSQVFLTDISWKQTISDVYRSLKPGGHFIFDARNPLARVWEEWEKDETPDLATHHTTGEQLEIWTEYEGFIEDVYTFYEIVRSVRTDEVLKREKMQLKFRTRKEIEASLQQVGFHQAEVYGDYEFEQATAESKAFIFHSIK